MDWGIIGALTGIVSLLLVALAGGRYIGMIDALAKRHETCPVVKLDKEIAVLTARFDMFLSTLEETIPKLLIHPHSPERDRLLSKMTRHELSRDEMNELLDDLQGNYESFNSGEKLFSALTISALKVKLCQEASRELVSDHANN